jgi:alpha-beta hydrolase superfamily lysophospholipase
MSTSPLSQPAAADTVVLIHGLWMTPRSWEHWVDHYTARGYQVLTPAYPGLEVEVEALRNNPSPIRDLTIPDVVTRLEQVIGALDRPPLLIGHSFGGVLVQILLDRGYGAAGVAINSVPAEGVSVSPPSHVRAVFPVLRNPANRNKVAPFTPKQFHFAFTNNLSEEESNAVYERYHIPAPGRFLWAGLLAKLALGRQDTWVNFSNDDRAPLLFIAGGNDNIMPAAINRSNAQHYRKSKATTDYKEFPGRSHYTIGEPGWQEVADYALDWAGDHSRRTTPALVAHAR